MFVCQCDCIGPNRARLIMTLQGVPKLGSLPLQKWVRGGDKGRAFCRELLVCAKSASVEGAHDHQSVHVRGGGRAELRRWSDPLDAEGGPSCWVSPLYFARAGGPGS